jgi:hypothetical protein
MRERHGSLSSPPFDPRTIDREADHGKDPLWWAPRHFPRATALV